MAQEKKSIIVYADWIDKFEALTDEEAGKLIKHFFRYVNDKDPIAENRIIEVSFIDIKSSLKRDLVKWTAIKGKRSNAGKASAEAKKTAKTPETTPQKKQPKSTKSTHVESVQQNQHNSTHSTVSVNVNVSDSVSILNTNSIDRRKLSFSNSLIPFVEIYGADEIRDFCDYWTEANKSNTKFKQEAQTTWNTELRLKRWFKNDFNKPKKLDFKAIDQSNNTNLFK